MKDQDSMRKILETLKKDSNKNRVSEKIKTKKRPVKEDEDFEDDDYLGDFEDYVFEDDDPALVVPVGDAEEEIEVLEIVADDVKLVTCPECGEAYLISGDPEEAEVCPNDDCELVVVGKVDFDEEFLQGEESEVEMVSEGKMTWARIKRPVREKKLELGKYNPDKIKEMKQEILKNKAPRAVREAVKAGKYHLGAKWLKEAKGVKIDLTEGFSLEEKRKILSHLKEKKAPEAVVEAFKKGRYAVVEKYLQR